ncbi:hypothetical protein GOBAR_DD33753 [Gossypium barbadense]|nr:hypothetical protein GOBAR_DD33753 [Gossypium barbadense]
MAEEHRCQAPKLCANNCGLIGSPATQNLCSKCHRDLQLKQHRSSSAKHAVNQTSIPSPSSFPSVSSSSYPEEHGCKFDFKAMGKQQIAQANPVVKAIKLHKI